MEGFSLQKGTGGNFINTFEGNFVTKVSEGTEGAVTRKNKLGTTVHELHFNTFVGLIVSITKKASEQYGFQWEIGLYADKLYTLQIPFSGGMPLSLLSRMVNTDLTKKVLIGIMQTENDKKEKRTYFWMYANPKFEGGRWTGEKVTPFWSKDNKNGLPEMVKVKIKGKDTWDDSEQMEYIEEYITENVVPRLPEVPESAHVSDGPGDDPDEVEQPKEEVKKAPLPAWMQGKKTETPASRPPSRTKKGKTEFESPTNQNLAPDGSKFSDTDDLPF